MKSFWQLDKRWNEMLTAFEESGGELTDELNELLAINRTDLDEVIEDQMSVMQYVIDDNERFKNEVEKLQVRIENNKKLIQVIRTNIKNAVEKYGTENKLKSAGFSFSIKKTQVVEVSDVSQIPSDYIVYKLKTGISRETKLNLIRIMSRFNLDFDETVKKDELKKDYNEGKVIDFGFKVVDNTSLVIR